VRVLVRAGGPPYPVIVGRRLLPGALREIRRHLSAPAYALVSDRRAVPREADPLARALRRAGARAEVFPFPPGEASKTREVKAGIEDALLRRGFGRDCALLTVGGGVAADLGGFVAATFLRGRPHGVVATTLLAMVDASVGGKVAVDLPAGKNLVGAFWQPRLVLAPLESLGRIPRRVLREGFAEAVKHGVVAEAAYFRRLEADAPALREGAPSALARLVEGSVRLKARVVESDPLEREGGRRAVLNFGHTVGHALEAAGGYRLRHGEAVALGMPAEAELAAEMGLAPASLAGRIEALLESLGSRVRTHGTPPTLRAVLAAAGTDKKNRRGVLRAALPRGLGRMDREAGYTRPVPLRPLRAVLRRRGLAS
jgi:3-dehydroquinate synthase